MTDRQAIRILTELEGLAERVVKKITLDVTANFVEDTPRDTGWAASNWVPQIGQPYQVNIGNLSREDAAAQVPGRRGQQEAGVATVAASYKLEQGAVFVSNNVPYILKLNDGHSKKAPAGFIQAGIEKAVTVQLGEFG